MREYYCNNCCDYFLVRLSKGAKCCPKCDLDDITEVSICCGVKIDENRICSECEDTV